LKRTLIIVANYNPIQPAIPFQGNFRARKQDRKRDHANDHQEFNQKEGKQKHVEHFILNSQRDVDSHQFRRFYSRADADYAPHISFIGTLES